MTTMEKKYDEIYALQPVGYDFAEGMTKLGDLHPCGECKTDTKFYDNNFKQFLCSDKCRGGYWLTYARTHLSGNFKNYRVIYKNKDSNLFPDVKVWFKDRYLYYEMNNGEQFKGRIDTFDIADIQFEQQYDSGI